VTEPDLFVVCKNCSAEVSPYVTECPYCGQRVRKRAPKLDRGTPPEPKPRRFRPPSLPRLRRDELPGIAPDTRPVATIALIVASLATTLVAVSEALAPSTEQSLYDMGALYLPIVDDWWRVVTTSFLHDNAGYQFVALVATGIFGTPLERRFGPVAAIATFVLCGAAGAAASELLAVRPALGANGAALGLLCAWLVEDRLAARRGDERGNDLLGVAVIAAVLALLPLAEEDASIAAAGGGALAGGAIGLVLGTFRR
jgi:membrane associated rhomboid family serine protease